MEDAVPYLVAAHMGHFRKMEDVRTSNAVRRRALTAAMNVMN